jgi:2-polyprenyl-3-methyl-5-hydroxy-6-metoxy-1,4-benzoquinol methylase
LHDSLIRHLGGVNKVSPVLDVGCGTGAWLERLSRAGFSSLHGIDLNAGQFGAAAATCTEGDLDRDEIALPEKKYGLISAIELVEHLENPGRLFNLVSESLADDGYFLLTTPNIHSLQCRLKFFLTGDLASFDAKGDPTHIYPVLLTSLRRVLPRYSLEIVKRWGYPERGSLIYRAPLRIISTGLGLFLPNSTPGDTLCLLLRKKS